MRNVYLTSSAQIQIEIHVLLNVSLLWRKTRRNISKGPWVFPISSCLVCQSLWVLSLWISCFWSTSLSPESVRDTTVFLFFSRQSYLAEQEWMKRTDSVLHKKPGKQRLPALYTSSLRRSLLLARLNYPKFKAIQTYFFLSALKDETMFTYS